MLKEETIDELTNKDLILNINGGDFLKTNEKDEQSLFYNEKDIEEDKELLDLFKINSNFMTKSRKKSNFII